MVDCVPPREQEANGESTIHNVTVVQLIDAHSDLGGTTIIVDPTKGRNDVAFA